MFIFESVVYALFTTHTFRSYSAYRPINFLVGFNGSFWYSPALEILISLVSQYTPQMRGYEYYTWDSYRSSGLIPCRPVTTWQIENTYFKAQFPLASAAVILLTKHPELLLIKPWSFHTSKNKMQIISTQCNIKVLKQLYQGALLQRQGLRQKSSGHSALQRLSTLFLF